MLLEMTVLAMGNDLLETGALTVTTQLPVDLWREQIAFRGRGLVTTDFLHDPNFGVLSGYREDNFKCVNGQPVYGGILELCTLGSNTLISRRGLVGMQ